MYVSSFHSYVRSSHNIHIYKISWLHHEQPSQYKAMYVSLGILSKEPPLPQSFIDTRRAYYYKTLLGTSERILETMPKSDSHSAVWQNVIKFYSCPLIQVEIKFLFEWLDKFIILSLNASQASDNVLKHNATLSKLLMSPSKYFPSTEEQVKLSQKEPAAIKHFNQEVQRPMLQEAVKVIKDHGTKWLSFPKLFGTGADQEFQSSFWSSVLRVLDIPLERKPGNKPIKNVHVYGQSIYTLVSKDKAGLVKGANLWNLQQPQLLNEIKAVATSHEDLSPPI